MVRLALPGQTKRTDHAGVHVRRHPGAPALVQRVVPPEGIPREASPVDPVPPPAVSVPLTPRRARDRGDCLVHVAQGNEGTNVVQIVRRDGQSQRWRSGGPPSAHLGVCRRDPRPPGCLRRRLEGVRPQVLPRRAQPGGQYAGRVDQCEWGDAVPGGQGDPPSVLQQGVCEGLLAYDERGSTRHRHVRGVAPPWPRHVAHSPYPLAFQFLTDLFPALE
mmetsp:Transcript_5133/g.18015  ORF Transcript_5133/g.18015 Transcript_5133/m.18015 type:complete len:218 (-) Transcript_5133:438-1091(-)